MDPIKEKNAVHFFRFMCELCLTYVCETRFSKMMTYKNTYQLKCGGFGTVFAVNELFFIAWGHFCY